MSRSIRDRDDPPYRGGADRWDQGAGGLNATLEFFGPAQPAPDPLPGGLFRVWTGSAWVEKPARFWFQGEWFERLVRRWTGTQWVPINPNPPPPPQLVTHSFFTGQSTSTASAGYDGGSPDYVAGLRLEVLVPGKLLGYRYYVVDSSEWDNNDVVRTFGCYREDTQALIPGTEVVVPPRSPYSATGWQDVLLPVPVQVPLYSQSAIRIAMQFVGGCYSYTTQYWTTTVTDESFDGTAGNGFRNPENTLFVSTALDSQSLLEIPPGVGPRYPAGPSFQNANYWVDILFQPD